MLLYGSADSGHSYKVRSFLLLSETPHRFQQIDLALPRAARPPAFVAVSRFCEVPVLVDEGTAYCQSNAILMHLAQRRNAFCGDGAEGPAIREWLFWETNRIGFSVPNLRYALRFAHQPADVLTYLRHRAIADLVTLDDALSRRRFLLPSGPTIADISCSAYLFWLSELGIAELEYPNIARWMDSLRAMQGWMHPDLAMKSESPNDLGPKRPDV